MRSGGGVRNPSVALVSAVCLVLGACTVSDVEPATAPPADDNIVDTAAPDGAADPAGPDDRPGDVLAALLDAAAAEAEFDGVTPLYRAYLDQIFPCLAEGYVELFGAILEPPFDAAGIRDSTARGERLAGSLVDTDSLGEQSHLDAQQHALDCAGGAYRAAVWDRAFGLSEAQTGGTAAAWLDYADCVLAASQPTQQELLADHYYWYYDNGGQRGPLADDPAAYSDLVVALNNRIADVQGAAVCDRPT